MAELVIRHVSDRALAALKERARVRQVELETVLTEIVEAEALLQPNPLKPEPPELSDAEREQRRKVVETMKELRRRTLRPRAIDSALLIREDRDTR